MLQRFIIALNSLNTPLIAIWVVILGCVYSIVCKHYGIADNSAQTIIGAGIGLLTGQALSRTKSDSVEGQPVVVQQSTGGAIGADTVAKALLLFLLVGSLAGCAARAHTKSSAGVASAPAISRPLVVEASAAAPVKPAVLTTTTSAVTAPASCPAGSSFVMNATAVDPNFAGASIHYVPVNDGTSALLVCQEAMAARTNAASNSTVPEPK